MRKISRVMLPLFGMLILTLILGFSTASFAETDVTDKIQLDKSRLRYDRRAGTSYLDVSLTNISQDVLLTPIKVVIDSVSDPSVTVADADGTTADGKPYFEYITDTGQFLSGQSTEAKTWTFANPNRRRFSYSLSVLAVFLDAAVEIGPEGGVVEVVLSDNTEIIIDIPEGSLSEDKNIMVASHVSVADVPDASRLAPAIDLGPDGTTFDKPITLTFKLTEENLQNAGFSSLEDGIKWITVYYFNDQDELWEPLQIANVNYSDNTIKVELDHFTVLEIVCDHYKVTQLALLNPVKKGEHLSFQVTVEYSGFLGLPVDTISLSARLNEQSVTKSVPVPDGSNTSAIIFSTLIGPITEQFVDLRIEKPAVLGPKTLWKQRLVVDYDTVVSNYRDAIEKYKPILEFAHGEEYHPTLVNDIFDYTETHSAMLFFGVETGVPYFIVNPSLDDLAVRCENDYSFGFEGDKFKSNEDTVKVVYASPPFPNL